MLSFQTLLGQLAAENGLAYYCRDDSLQTLLKHAVNITKDSLRYTTIIVGNTPILGPILGPCQLCFLNGVQFLLLYSSSGFPDQVLPR